MKICIIDLLGLQYKNRTIDLQGLGGSESAVICISRAMNLDGHHVIIYNNHEGSKFENISYRNISNPIEEKFDVVISSRSLAPFTKDNPFYPIVKNSGFNILWMHDTFVQGDENLESILSTGIINRIFTLSDWHSLYVSTAIGHGPRRHPETILPYIYQTRNGIYKVQDVDPKMKDPNLCVFNASVTKGLEPLLDMWPTVIKTFPEKKLKVVGGFYRMKEPDQQEKDWTALKKKHESENVEFLGVIPQKEISDLLAKATYFLYPSDFPETFGISTIEAQAHKCVVLTCSNGALAENAHPNSSFKIKYPIKPNGVFPHLKNQYAEFIDIIFQAFRNPYLVQQKSYNGSIFKDIISWDQIWKEWRYEIEFRTKQFSDVELFRSVKKSLEDSSRILNRRISNYQFFEKRYPEKFIQIISPVYKASDYIQNHIKSVAAQDYRNYRHLVIDDEDEIWSTIKNIENTANRHCIGSVGIGALANQFKFRNLLDTDITIFLDGDDWLINNPTIFNHINNLFNEGYDFGYGSCWSYADNIPLIAQEFQTKEFRKEKFNWGMPYTHLRWMASSILNSIPNSVIFKDGEYIKAGGDNVLFYEAIERANKIHCEKEILMVYNDQNPLNDYKVNSSEQKVNSEYVQNINSNPDSQTY